MMKLKSRIGYLLSILFIVLFLTDLSAQKKKYQIEKNPDVVASYIEGQNELDKFLKKNIDYNKVIGDKGKVNIGFVVEKDGSSNSMFLADKNGVGFAVEAARVLSLIDNWLPAKKSKELVRSLHYISVKFKRPKNFKFPEVVPIDKSTVNNGVGARQPQFPGGPSAFGKFLSENIVYPGLAMEYNIHGKVYIKYIIQKDGQIANAEVLRGIGHGCDLEALRLMALSPLWELGFQEGKAVNVWYTIPINFQLQ
ncbi:MAG: hypothetical protein ACI8XB_000480 [Patiriisocius sp.]|jgi:hypothetical protein